MIDGTEIQGMIIGGRYMIARGLMIDRWTVNTGQLKDKKQIDGRHKQLSFWIDRWNRSIDRQINR